MIELSILLTIFISVGVMTLFISILIEQYIVDKNTIIIM